MPATVLGRECGVALSSVSPMRQSPLGLLIALVAAGCAASGAPSGVDGAPGTDAMSPDAYDGVMAVISGRVWVPKMAPGDVPAGEEIPVAGAVVYLATEPPPAIPAGVYCQRCMET